jgi:hypothetical protein
MNGPDNLDRSLFLSLSIGPYLPPTYRPLVTFLVLFEDAQMASKCKKKKNKNLFSGCFGPFPINEWA